MANILASMTIALGSDTKQFVSGMKNAASHLTKFQNSADKLKGVDLTKMAPNFSGVISSVSQLERESRKLRTAIRYATDEKSVVQLNEQLERTQTEIKRIQSLGKTSLGGIATGGNQAAKGMNNLAGSAGTVNQEFARIIQDAPFGMMGIGNNIQQLTANFGQLSRQAGGAGAAIKASLAAMITPASLLTLGIAAVTSGWVLYEKWSQKSAKATREAASAMKSAKKEAEEYIETLTAVNQARVKGTQSAQEELITLRLLYQRTQDVKLSLQERKKAADQILEQYPKYFKGLTSEEVLAGKAKDAYDKLSSSILATAKARAAQDLLAANARKQLINEQKIVDLQAEQVKKQEKAAKDQAALARVNEKLRERGDNSQAGAAGMLKVRMANEEKQIVSEINSLNAQNNKLKQDALRLEKMINLEMSKGGELTGSLSGGEKDRVNQKIKTLQAVTKPVEVPLMMTVQSDFSAAPAENILAIAESFKAIPRAIAPASAAMTSFFDKQAQEIVDKAMYIGESVAGFVAPAFSALGEGFADMFNGMASGMDVLKNVGRALLKAVSDFAGEFGKRLIAIGIGENLLLPGSGIAKIVAGGALVALSAFSGGMMKGGGKPSGGNFSPSIASSYQPPKANMPNQSQAPGEKEIKLRLMGHDLVAALKTNQYYASRIG